MQKRCLQELNDVTEHVVRIEFGCELFHRVFQQEVTAQVSTAQRYNYLRNQKFGCQNKIENIEVPT